jgi:uncharacterized protein
MLLVKTYIAPSKIHGTGLFAVKNIAKGTITWRFDPAIDIAITPKQLAQLPKVAREFVEEYGSLSILSGNYIISADNARFTNHSSIPNLDTKIAKDEPEAVAVANKEIAKGEEMTIDYKSFDKISAKSGNDYLIR